MLGVFMKYLLFFSRRNDRVNYARRLVEEDEMEVEEEQAKVCLVSLFWIETSQPNSQFKCLFFCLLQLYTFLRLFIDIRAMLLFTEENCKFQEGQKSIQKPTDDV